MSEARQSTRKTVVFVCLSSEAHINSVLNLANHLNDKGHRTVFLFTEPIENTLKDLGHEVYDCTTPDLSESKCDFGQSNYTQLVMTMQATWKSGIIIDTLEIFYRIILSRVLDKTRNIYNENVEQKMKLLDPDFLIIDNYFGIPALHKLAIPYARVFAAAPLPLYCHEDLPQAWLGLPTIWNKEDLKQRNWNERAYKLKKMFFDEYNAFWQSYGLSGLPEDTLQLIPDSPYLNIYMYPEELDYKEYMSLKNWTRCDSMVRVRDAIKFDLPEKLKDKSGKLIYLSLGSMACADVTLMKRLTSMLVDSPHRYIVVTGPNSDEYELPDNMWGDRYLPQLEILTVIDLIITHGGNNTITECFYYGVPGFVVCPLFFDQFDNARRIEETGFGIQLDPYNCTKEALHGAIETMLSRAETKERMRVISERMQKPESRNKALNLISDFVSSNSKVK